MDSNIIVEQLGYMLDDERVNVDENNYMEVKINDKLSVTADHDCNTVVVTLFNRLLLFVDLESRETINIIIPVRRYNNDYYEMILDINQNGYHKFRLNANSEKSELLQHKKIEKCKTVDIIHTIRTILEENDILKDFNFEESINKICRALYPLIDQQLKELNYTDDNSMTEFDSEETLESAKQRRIKLEERLNKITSSKPVAFVKKLARKIKKQ